MAQKVQFFQGQKALCAKIYPLLLFMAILNTLLWAFLFWSHTLRPWGRKEALIIPCESEI